LEELIKERKGVPAGKLGTPRSRRE